MIRNALRATGRGVGVCLLTAVEVVALSVWLGLVSDAPAVSGAAAIGVAALAAGLLVQGLGTHVTVKGWRREVPSPSVVAVALFEALLWVVWLAAVRQADTVYGVALAGVALAVALVPRHTVRDNLLRGRRPLSSLAERTPVGLAVLEAAGASAWILVVSGTLLLPEWTVSVAAAGFTWRAVLGAALLTAALLVQHALAVRYALRSARRADQVDWRTSWGTPPD